MLRYTFSARCVRTLSTGSKAPPPPASTKPPVVSRPSVSAKAPSQPQKPPANAFQPAPAASYSTPYKANEYYAFSQYSFYDLGGRKQALRNPQPSPKH